MEDGTKQPKYMTTIVKREGKFILGVALTSPPPVKESSGGDGGCAVLCCARVAYEKKRWRKGWPI